MADKQQNTSFTSWLRSNFCCCFAPKQTRAVLLDEDSRGDEPREKRALTVLFGPNSKGLGLKVKSTFEGPKITKVSGKRWNQIQTGDKILEMNNDSIIDSDPEDVQFILSNIDTNEVILTVEREVQILSVALEKRKRGFGFDFKKSSDSLNHIIVNKIHTNHSNGCLVGDKVVAINDIDAAMINIDDLQSMLDTPGKKTLLSIERIV